MFKVLGLIIFGEMPDSYKERMDELIQMRDSVIRWCKGEELLPTPLTVKGIEYLLEQCQENNDISGMIIARDLLEMAKAGQPFGSKHEAEHQPLLAASMYSMTHPHRNRLPN